jgi:uncharacterized protein with HEPN domain
MKDDRFYLLHIEECIHDILDYIKEGHDSFIASRLIQDAVIRKLQIMAESTLRLPEDLKTAHPTVNWRGIRGFRNVVVHDYLSVDLDTVWAITQNDLPPLKHAVESMLQNLQS